MIKLRKTDKETIIAHARAQLPEEACGLLGGVLEENGDKTVKAVYLLTNTDHSPTHFSMDPREQLSAIRSMRQNGLVPLGNFHSHPETPSRPSEEDKRLAYDSTASYLILSLAEDTPVLKSFHIEGNAAAEEPFMITEE